jgi:hypothetical protein
VGSQLSPETKAAITEVAREAAAEAAHEALAELVTDGLDEAEAQSLLVKLLDGILAWRLFVGEPLASLLEAGDGPAIEKALVAISPALIEAFKRDPDKIEERARRAAKRGHNKVAARRRARARRIRVRQAD